MDQQTSAISEAGGVLVVDKPEGLTSHDVVARVRRLFGTKRVGHTGTLDPFATGVLVVLVGRATRLAQFLSGAEKEYEALIRFGFRTDTGDSTGTPLDHVSTAVATDLMTRDEAEFETALAGLRGEIEQTPPMYSVKKIKGQKLYELARKGVEIERATVRINIREFEIMPDEAGVWLHRNDDGTCDLRARVVCSAGTYIRVLAEDLGAKLGIPSHLAALRRTRAGAFTLTHSTTLDDLQALAEREDRAAHYDKIILSVDVLPDMIAVHLTHDQLARVRHGASFRVDDLDYAPDLAHVRLVAPKGHLVAIGAYDREMRSVHPRVMLDIEARG